MPGTDGGLLRSRSVSRGRGGATRRQRSTRSRRERGEALTAASATGSSLPRRTRRRRRCDPADRREEQDERAATPVVPGVKVSARSEARGRARVPQKLEQRARREQDVVRASTATTAARRWLARAGALAEIQSDASRLGRGRSAAAQRPGTRTDAPGSAACSAATPEGDRDDRRRRMKVSRQNPPPVLRSSSVAFWRRLPPLPVAGARAGRAIGDGLDVNQPRPDGAIRGDEPGRRPGQAFLWQIEDAAGPGRRRSIDAVDRDAEVRPGGSRPGARPRPRRTTAGIAAEGSRTVARRRSGRNREAGSVSWPAYRRPRRADRGFRLRTRSSAASRPSRRTTRALAGPADQAGHAIDALPRRRAMRAD